MRWAGGLGPGSLQRSRLSISSISMPDEPFESEVERVARHGLGGIGLWEYKIEGHDIGHVKAHLDAHGLRATNCIPIGNTVYPGQSYPAPADPRAVWRLSVLGLRALRLSSRNPSLL